MNLATKSSKLIHFLRDELKIPKAHLDPASRLGKAYRGPLHLILWQYGLISLAQLERILNWLSTSGSI